MQRKASEKQALSVVEVIEKGLRKNDVVEMALYRAGMTPESVAKMLFELCSWKSVKIDKNGEVHEYVDGALRLKAIDLWQKITGGPKKEGTTHNHLHLENLPDGKLDQLYNKIRKG